MKVKNNNPSIDLIMFTTSGKDLLCALTLETWTSKIKFSNVIIASDKPITPLNARTKNIHHDTFGSRMSEALKACSSTYVLIILDDYYLHSINVKQFQTALELFQKMSPDAIKLFKSHSARIEILLPNYCGFGKLGNTGLGFLDTHPTLYNVDKLKQVVDESETLWEHEINHASRCMIKGWSVLATTQNIINYSEIVKGGKLWFSCRNFHEKTKLQVMPLEVEIKVRLVSWLKAAILSVLRYDTLRRLRK